MSMTMSQQDRNAAAVCWFARIEVMRSWARNRRATGVKSASDDRIRNSSNRVVCSIVSAMSSVMTMSALFLPDFVSGGQSTT